MGRDSLYAEHLARVSRSFAVCIEELGSDLKAPVSLAYIHCRLVDTIEDSSWPNPEDQQRAFATFSQFINHRPETLEVLRWQKSFPLPLPQGEALLIEQAATFIEDLHLLPQQVRTPIQRVVTNMIAGMQVFCLKAAQLKVLRLTDRIQVNNYCFFVAGIVGELLTELFHLFEPGVSLGRSNLRRAVEFGFYLQKINILKDQRSDEAAGRFFVYSREEILKDLLEHAKATMDYILAIPARRPDIRLFCAWSYFIGLAALPFIQGAWSQPGGLSLPRAQTLALMAKVREIIASDALLRALSEKMIAAIAAPVLPGSRTGLHQVMDSTLSRAYSGLLDEMDLSALGVLQPD